MKNIITIAALFISFYAYSQDTTIVLNLQLKAGTIKALAERAKNSDIDAYFNVFLKWRTNFKANNPSDNANVSTDTIPTKMVADLYDFLFQIGSESFLDDYRTSIQSKRNTNDYLDDLCTALEAIQTNRETGLKSRGAKLLLGN